MEHSRQRPQAGVRPRSIVPIEMYRDPRLRFKDTVVGVQVDLFVFHRPPQPFDENTVAQSALTIHAHLAAPAF